MKRKKVSIWLADFISEDALFDYLEIDYPEEDTDDEDFIASDFMKDFKIEHYDEDFQEAYRAEELPISWRELVAEVSYAESFSPEIPDRKDHNNSAIVLYDFVYHGKVEKCKNVVFLGVFDYIQD